MGGKTIAIYTARTKGVGHKVLEAAILADGSEFESRNAVLDYFLECFLRFYQKLRTTQINLYISTDAFDLEELCLRRGFQRASSSPEGMLLLNKVVAPKLVTKSNWSEFRQSFAKQTDVELPTLLPNYPQDVTYAACINAGKNQRAYELPIQTLETFISPSLILFPKREGVLISIQPAYASDLLARDKGLLPFPTTLNAILRSQKVYYGNTKHKKFFHTGMPIVFYESKNGRGSVGYGRIVSTEVCSVDNALKLYREHGVLSKKELENYQDNKGNVHVIVFDNFNEFSKPVGLKQLKEYGCAKANLVSPEKLSFSQLYNILHAGNEVSARDVIISIQPNYVAKILSGKKTIELRKKSFPANGGVRVWIYSTKPSSAIEATAYVSKYEVDSPQNIWQKYSKKCGISKADYDAYYDGCEEAYALTISQAKKLTKKVKLDELKNQADGFSPPQYFRYVKHDSDLYATLIDLK